MCDWDYARYLCLLLYTYHLISWKSQGNILVKEAWFNGKECIRKNSAECREYKQSFVSGAKLRLSCCIRDFSDMGFRDLTVFGMGEIKRKVAKEKVERRY